MSSSMVNILCLPSPWSFPAPGVRTEQWHPAELRPCAQRANEDSWKQDWRKPRALHRTFRSASGCGLPEVRRKVRRNYRRLFPLVTVRQPEPRRSFPPPTNFLRDRAAPHPPMNSSETHLESSHIAWTIPPACPLVATNRPKESRRRRQVPNPDTFQSPRARQPDPGLGRRRQPQPGVGCEL